jgi:hypothetical protein
MAFDVCATSRHFRIARREHQRKIVRISLLLRRLTQHRSSSGTLLLDSAADALHKHIHYLRLTTNCQHRGVIDISANFANVSETEDDHLLNSELCLRNPSLLYIEQRVDGSLAR